MHLRRALLLFAIVLGLAALATTISSAPQDEQRPSEESRSSTPPTPTSGDSLRAPLRLDAVRPAIRRLEAGRAATVTVAVDEPGLVEIPKLGLSSPADRPTPARFELLEREEGRYRIAFTPADAEESRSAGTIVVTSPKR